MNFKYIEFLYWKTLEGGGVFFLSYLPWLLDDGKYFDFFLLPL